VEKCLVVLVSGELDGGVGDDSGHGCGVAAPQSEKSFVLVRHHKELDSTTNFISFL